MPTSRWPFRGDPAVLELKRDEVSFATPAVPELGAEFCLSLVQIFNTMPRCYAAAQDNCDGDYTCPLFNLHIAILPYIHRSDYKLSLPAT
jgi:hypothetical protein